VAHSVIVAVLIGPVVTGDAGPRAKIVVRAFLPPAAAGKITFIVAARSEVSVDDYAVTAPSTTSSASRRVQVTRR